MRFNLFFRFLITLTFFLSLLSNNLVLALPQARPTPEAVPSPDSLPPASLLVMDEPEFSSAPSAPTGPAIPDVRALPADVAELPELVDQRTANSATFQTGPNHYTTIVDAGALHYQDSQGSWQVIDPTFRPAENSFIVRNNSIRSRAGQSAARLSAAVNDAIIIWQATTLGVVTGQDRPRFIPLAEALAEPASFAQKREDGRVLHYADNWSDPSLAEEIVSAPGSLEHLLILSESPRVDANSGSGDFEFLEMRATLRLLPGAELWADGQSLSNAFETAGGLEIRNAEGTVVLVFDPVLAFERERPSIAVEGTYSAQPGDEPGIWTIGLRTPWHWWTDPARRYPAVIDPTMHVLRSTGYGTGMAWVADGHSSNPDSTGQALHFGEMVLGSWVGSGRYSGYVQFNSIPFMLTNAPIAINAAYVDIEPSHVRMPYYSGWEGIDFEMYPTQHDATLYDLGQCPGDCGGFSLVSNPVGFDWNNVPQGTATWDIPLTGPPWKGGGQTSVTSWDVTTSVRNWNQQIPRPADGPAFRLTVNTNCPVGSFDGESAKHTRKCTRLVVPAGNARLRIEYDELPIAVGWSFLNNPGVPSFYEGVFEEGTTSHQYDLAIPAGLEHWRAAAVRGNHALDPALPTRTGLKLVDHSNEPVDLVNGTVQEADKTAVVLIDEHNPNNLIEAADLWAEVTASNDNDFSSDEGRNYRIEHKRATDWAVPYSAWQTQNISYKTDQLINMGEFDLLEGDSVLIRVSAPITFPLTIGLAAPTTGSDKEDSALGNVNLDKKFEPVGQPVRDKSFTVSTSGMWALALINEGRPIADPRPPPGSAAAHQVVVEILRCPLGTIATARWICQPVILPDSGTPSRTGLGLTVYSEGGFTPGDTWCTQNEGSGTPIIGPDVNGRWVVVGQGSVCFDDAGISTTDDSGIGLAIEIPNPNPFPDGTVRGKLPPTLIYGSVAHYPLPGGYPTGVVVRAGISGVLQPEVDTRRNLAPFDEYWGSVFAPDSDLISTDEMKAIGKGIVHANVTVDAAADPENVDWAVAWYLYPEKGALYEYKFDTQAQQSPALHSPTSAILLASLQLRILDDVNVATGLIEALDAHKLESNVFAGQFRAGKAKITQDDDLGGTTKNVQVVVQPPGFTRLPAGEKSCSRGSIATSCLDLRRDDYDWDNGGGDKNVQLWELPDIHIVDSAGLMMFNRPGQLQIYSADHPDAVNFDQSFSFDTWGATVSVKEEACTPGGPVVTVVRGTANIALPSIGDDGGGATTGVTVNFKLCQAKLYQAKITLSIPPPGIPAGSTGVGVNLIGGEITIDPDFTQIELELGFQTIDGGTVTGGHGSVLIDTRGLFELQASALIVGLLDAELLLQVAWSPLDILLEAGVSCCGGLISGGLYMHAWLGQGWQHKYPWLPDNDDFHFAGSIHATLKIPEGYIADVGIAELPPFDFTRSLKISFGEFCTNSSCTSYDWGMSVVFTIVSIDVGLYVDGGGPEFILGTDSHVLIDQFGSSQQSLAQANAPEAPAPPPFEVSKPGNWQVFTVKLFKTPVDDWPIQAASDYGCTGMGTSVHTCPITVGAGAGRALFTIGWENGNLDVALIKPDLTVITPANAATHSVTVSDTSTLLADQVSFGVPESAITSGVWQVQMSNVISDTQAPFQTNYQILYAAEPPPPTLTWNSPLNPSTTPDAGGIATLDWAALRAGQPLTPGIKIELFYAPLDQKPITPTLMTGTLIVNQIAANQATYAWDTNGLASGEYAVGGRIDDHVNANGHIVAWAPGTLVINDTTPPPVPNILGQIDLKDALIVVWERDNDTLDLAGYLVEYTIPAWDETAPQLDRVRRMLPHSPDQWPWVEVIRLGGLLGGLPTTYCVRAYDASGNASDCDPVDHHLPVEPPRRLGPPRRITAWGGRDSFGETRLRIDWLSPDPSTGTPAGYALSYSLAGCVLPGASSLANEGPSPIDVGNVLAYNLTGLTIGQTYRLAVNGYTANGYFGPKATTYALFVDLSDEDSDGLPDQWADLYNLTGGAGDDPDGDGLTNEEELLLMSNPVHADSDADGYYDGEEVDWGTDLCGPEHPPYHTGPKLTLVGMSEFEFATASNQAIVAPQNLFIFNLGGGTLEWSATASEPWITLGSEMGSGQSTLSIGVDPRGLAVGHYAGTVTLTSSSTRDSVGPGQATDYQEVATIDVSLRVLAPKDPGHFIFLPLVFR